jgi:hypothetical protein
VMSVLFWKLKKVWTSWLKQKWLKLIIIYVDVFIPGIFV